MSPKFQKYSVIIPSYNRKEEIRELIPSFAKLEFPPERVELLIVDDGSTDGTPDEVKILQKEFPFELRLFCQENKGPAAARTLGMEKAAGDFLIFVDSDCTFSPDWLRNIDRELEAQDADAFGGRDSFRKDFPALLKAINYSMTSFITTGGLRGAKGKKLAKYYPRSFNMGLSRTVYKKIGGFGVLRYYGEDIEFSHKIIKTGAKVIYIDDAVVFHKRRTSLKKFFQQVYKMGKARILLYKLDPELLEPLHAAPAVATIFFLFSIAGSVLFLPFWEVMRWIYLAGIIALVLSGAHAGWQYRSLKVLFLVPVAITIQVLGYGFGFSCAALQLIFSRDK